ncbi:hypothetical protein Agub_g83 [Astrephomene gubernaculifera]|uniref:Uncharacterized protein n=1 Tax=Astrephomene gubernaculifera TaxID=47775 RepID=A0AAD3HFR4_9CHLO|nr:hypothetical protein Agub_g83 [Astrephomene gubernaculifera]
MNVMHHASACDAAARTQRMGIVIATGPSRIATCAVAVSSSASAPLLPPTQPPLSASALPALPRHALPVPSRQAPSRRQAPSLLHPSLRTRTRSTQASSPPPDPHDPLNPQQFPSLDPSQPSTHPNLDNPSSAAPSAYVSAATDSFSDPAASTWDPQQQPYDFSLAESAYTATLPPPLTPSSATASTAAPEAAEAQVPAVAAAAAEAPAGSAAAAVPRSPHAPRRVCIFVEPSPFTYVSGYKNRFTTMIRFLVEAGCEVLVVTTGKGYTLPGVDSSSFREQPGSWAGARVVSALSFGCPWYAQVPLSFALSPRIWREVRDFRPDLIHCSSPGVMVFAAKLYAWLLRAPIVLSYHTHVPSYLPRYGISWLVPAMWGFLRLLHATAHLTLTVSPAMVEELLANKAVERREQIQVWKKGVDSDTFHPRFRCDAMRSRLTAGRPERPVLVYVGRLGFEKNLFFLRRLLDRNPGVSLAFVGDGPARAELQTAFQGTPTTFLGMLHGEDLSSAYASSDVFVMPSESETLGFVVLEAMAAQLPVVAVRAGGIPDIIRPEDNGVTGFLYEPGDEERAAELVGQLAADLELRARVGARARQEVAKWDWRAATLHLLNVQYPLAMAAAAVQYGRALGQVAAEAAAGAVLASQQQEQAAAALTAQAA